MPHRKDIVSGRHTGAAVEDGRGIVVSDSTVEESLPELGFFSESAGRREILAVRQRTGAGNVPGDRIDRFRPAKVPIEFTRIEKRARSILDVAGGDHEFVSDMRRK